MLGRKMYPLAVALGLWTGGEAMAESKAPATKPASVKVDNQKLADTVAAKLKASGVIKGAKIGIEAQGGTVVLSGTVTSQKQHEDILRAVTGVEGVTRIESEIQAPIPAPAGVPVIPASAKTTPAAKPTPAAKQMPAPAAQPSNIIRTGGEAEQGPGFIPPAGPPGGPYPFPPNGAAQVSQDPIPLNGQPAFAPLDPSGPRLPPNAWPTYAPYNNMSRVAYPAAYPYNAFPYIGPFYPFPKVPLGWRKVVLEWDDGHWYMGRLQSPHDHWRVKFW